MPDLENKSQLEEIKKEVEKEELKKENSSTDDIEFYKTAATEGNKVARREFERASALEAELNDLKSKASGGDKNVNEFKLPTKDEYYADPAQSTVNIVKQLLDESIAPLRDAASNLTRRDAYGDLRNQFSNDPKWKGLFEKAGPIVDSLMSKLEPNSNNMRGVLYQLRGAIAGGEVDGLTFDDINGTTKKKEEPVNGNLAPSSSPAPSNSNQNRRRGLTESEKSVARRRGLSDDQFLDLFDGPDEVTFSHIDKTLTTKKD